MARSKKHKRKSARIKSVHSPKWFSRRSVTLIFIAATLAIIVVFASELRGLFYGARAASIPGWIIDGDQLEKLLAYTPSNLPKAYFNTSNTFVLRSNDNPKTYIPTGWKSQTGNHYTSFSQNNCHKGCYSFMKDSASSSFGKRTKPQVVMYDDEYWGRTPGSEQHNPCEYMGKFVTTAHGKDLVTIVAPDQDLAEPGIITNYQGGETENWQTYLRLGLGTCAAQTGSQWYHIMSQPFESRWCSPLGKCQSSESDFVNFVTQAALQARAVNPKVKISDGLSTSPKYFGNFRGAETFAKIMYRDYTDVRDRVDAVWMNIVGHNANATTLYFLSKLSKHEKTEIRSSVLYLRGDDSLQTQQPGSDSGDAFDLGEINSSRTFVSNQTLPAGSSLPAGTGEFQFWTGGKSSDNAKINVTFGFCQGNNCAEQKIIKRLSFWVHGDTRGAAAAGGAFTTGADTILPSGLGPYRLFVQLGVSHTAPVKLLFGSKNSPTNLATPVLFPL